MKRSMVLLLVVMVALGSVGLWNGRPVSADAQVQGLWIFSDEISTPAARDTLVQRSAASGVTDLYLSIYRSALNSAGRRMYQDGDIADLIAKAHLNGLAVWAAYGNTDWPAIGCSPTAWPLQRMAEVVAYNTANPNAQFNGVILDVEPPEPQSAANFQSLLTLYQCTRTFLPSNLKLAVAIRFYWDTLETSVAFPVDGPVKRVYQHIIDLNLDHIVVMGYRDFVGTANCAEGDGLICLDQDEIAYADTLSKPNLILVGLETSNCAPGCGAEKVTFYEEGQSALDIEKLVVATHFGGHPSFGGFAVHRYNAAYLSGQPRWPIGSSEGLRPGALLIYYGWPSSINGTYSVAGAAAELGQYDYVVLGDGLEKSSHGDHANTVGIIADPQMADTKVFGYIDLGVTTQNLPMAEITTRVDEWQATGAQGILFDDFGYDWGTTRQRQNEAVAYAHGRGMSVLANAFRPEDAFGSQVDPFHNPAGTATNLNAGDYYLYESYQIRETAFVSEADWQAKSVGLQAYRAAIGFKVLAVTTNDAANAYGEQKFFYAWYSALMDEYEAVGWGEYNFSAATAQAPFRARPSIDPGSSFAGAMLKTGSRFSRNTNLGTVYVDTATHTSGFFTGGASNVIVKLLDSQGNGLAGGTAQYYDGGWQAIPGSTDASGTLVTDIPTTRGNLTFRMTYANASQEMAQNVSSNPIVVFQTANVTVELRDSGGTLIPDSAGTGAVQYYAGGWRDFGTTMNGVVSKQLLPLTYSFSTVSYTHLDVYKRQPLL